MAEERWPLCSRCGGKGGTQEMEGPHAVFTPCYHCREAGLCACEECRSARCQECHDLTDPEDADHAQAKETGYCVGCRNEQQGLCRCGEPVATKTGRCWECATAPQYDTYDEWLADHGE